MGLSRWLIVITFSLAGVTVAAPSTVMLPSSPAAAAEDEEFQIAFKDLPEEERRLLTAFMARSALGSVIAGIPMGGITITQAIAQQRAFDAKEMAEREAKQKKKKAEEELTDALKSTLLFESISVEEAQGRGFLGETIKVAVTATNTSGQPIAGVKVFVEVLDIFRDRLGSYVLKSDVTIPPGGVHVLTERYDGSKVLEADQSKISMTAEPLHVVFEDRTELKSSKRVYGF